MILISLTLISPSSVTGMFPSSSIQLLCFKKGFLLASTVLQQTSAVGEGASLLSEVTDFHLQLCLKFPFSASSCTSSCAVGGSGSCRTYQSLVQTHSCHTVCSPASAGLELPAVEAIPPASGSRTPWALPVAGEVNGCICFEELNPAPRTPT